MVRNILSGLMDEETNKLLIEIREELKTQRLQGRYENYRKITEFRVNFFQYLSTATEDETVQEMTDVLFPFGDGEYISIEKIHVNLAFYSKRFFERGLTVALGFTIDSIPIIIHASAMWKNDMYLVNNSVVDYTVNTKIKQSMKIKGTYINNTHIYQPAWFFIEGTRYEVIRNY